jgi:hypothetical protein
MKQGGYKMNRQKKVLKTRRTNLCVICHKRLRRDESRTCDQHCAGKLAWKTRRYNN